MIRIGDKSEYKPGDTIIFRRYSVDEIKLIDQEGSKTFYFVSDEDIIAKVKLTNHKDEQ